MVSYKAYPLKQSQGLCVLSITELGLSQAVQELGVVTEIGLVVEGGQGGYG